MSVRTASQKRMLTRDSQLLWAGGRVGSMWRLGRGWRAVEQPGVSASTRSQVELPRPVVERALHAKAAEQR